MNALRRDTHEIRQIEIIYSSSALSSCSKRKLETDQRLSRVYKYYLTNEQLNVKARKKGGRRERKKRKERKENVDGRQTVRDIVKQL